MDNKGLISVIIPVYNAENTIEHCVEAVLRSHYESLEIVLINDGSSDNSSNIINTLSTKYTNVKAFDYENGGAATARNRGVANAQGEYVSFIDSDDLITEDYFNTLFSTMQKYDSDVSVCSYKKIYGPSEYAKTLQLLSEGNYSHASKDANTYVFNTEEAVSNLLYQRHFISSPWGMLSKRELWNNVHFPDGKRAEDMATIYKLFAEAKSVCYTDAELYLYYQSKSSTIYTTQDRLNPDYYGHCIDMMNFVSEKMPSVMLAAKSRTFSACFQILSETPVKSQNKEFIQKLYATVHDLRHDVLCDKNGKPRNRIASLLSYISIVLLHRTLRAYYIIKCLRT